MLFVTALITGILVLPSIAEDLPLPRIVILGQTGSGKSTLANVLLGQNPDCHNCTFTICDENNSCTKETTYAVGTWLGDGQQFTIVDTPGFKASENPDTEMIDELMEVLHTIIKGANAVILVINGEVEQFVIGLLGMMRDMQARYGEAFWNNTIIEVSRWPYDAQSVQKRNITGETEDAFMAFWNSLLQEKFHIKQNLTGVFIDSWAQQPWNLEDQLQQEAFLRETEKLKMFFNSHKEFPFRTIEDVLSENKDNKEEIRWLNDVITKNISQIKDELIPGIGTIVPWIPSPEGPNSLVLSTIPLGWQQCDGSLITSGPFINLTTPDLNGQGLFLRGGEESSVTTVQEDMLRDHSHIDHGHSHSDTGHHHTQDSHGHTVTDTDGYSQGFIVQGTGDLVIDDQPEGDSWISVHLDMTTPEATPTIHPACASISKEKSDVSTVADHYNKGEENRPKNMVVSYIMRIF